MIGATVSTQGGLHKSIIRGKSWDCECIQIYITSSRAWRVSELKQDLLDAYLLTRAKFPIPIIAHVPYLVNLASPKEQLWQSSINRLVIEINRAACLNINLVVLHPGSSNLGGHAALQRIVKALDSVGSSMKDNNVKICLETMAGQGNSYGSRLEDIAEIYNSVNDNSFLGICLDTAHMFEAGYDFSDRQGARNVICDVDSILGIDQIEVIHLNDSKTIKGSKVDRHAFIGEGVMSLEAFHEILNFPKFTEIPKIIEMPRDCERLKEQIFYLKKLQKLSKKDVKEEISKILPAEQEALF